MTKEKQIESEINIKRELVPAVYNPYFYRENEGIKTVLRSRWKDGR